MHERQKQTLPTVTRDDNAPGSGCAPPQGDALPHHRHHNKYDDTARELSRGVREHSSAEVALVTLYPMWPDLAARRPRIRIPVYAYIHTYIQTDRHVTQYPMWPRHRTYTR